MRISYFPLLILAIVIAALAIALYRPQKDTSPVGGRAVPNLRLQTLRGDDLNFTSIPGPYVLNIFATWCLPCRLEHPQLMEMQRRHIPVYGVAYKDSTDVVKAYLQKEGRPYERVFLDFNGISGVRLGISGVPETFIINASGKIIHHHAGPLLAADMEDFLNRWKEAAP